MGVVSCCCEGSRPARFEEPGSLWLIERICALSAGQTIEQFVVEALEPCIGPLCYEVKATSERDADAVVRKLQTEMRDAEGRLAATLLENYPDALIICDGPPALSGRRTQRHRLRKNDSRPTCGAARTRRRPRPRPRPAFAPLCGGRRARARLFRVVFQAPRPPTRGSTASQEWSACKPTPDPTRRRA